jgi:hypothetical protein
VPVIPVLLKAEIGKMVAPDQPGQKKCLLDSISTEKIPVISAMAGSLSRMVEV